MKATCTKLLFLLLMAMLLGENPAFACNINQGIATQTNMLISKTLALSACMSFPVSLWLWRVKKIKARYTILPSLLAVIITLAAAALINQVAFQATESMSNCQKMQGVGQVFNHM